jgi:uncharacterized protein
MRLDKSRQSDNVEDIRGQSPRRGPGLKLGIGGTLVALVVSYFLGVDPRTVMGVMQAGQQQGVPATAEDGAAAAPKDEAGIRAAIILGDTEQTWEALFQAGGGTYEQPKLVLFSDAVDTQCGSADAGMGPFYCPADRKVYIDLAFFDELATRFQAPGDFAQAYVIAHEVGHHVQNLLGISDKVHAARQRASEAEGNALSVRLELQADCFAGVWAHNAERSRQILESGDLEEALGAAAAVGDDTLQQRSRGTVVPDSFTHGTSAQRMTWFKRGLEQGKLEACDTFSARG